MDAQDQIKRGVLWLGSATIAARLLDVGATVAVLGLLGKAEMGLGALAISACAVVESLSGLGVGQALVQDPNVSREEKSSLFWFTSGCGLVLGLALVALSPALASYYDEPALLPLVAASGFKLFLIGTSVVPLQLLNRDLKFREIGAVQTLASLGEGLTKIALAAAGTGAWALIAGNVARGAVLVAALWALSSFRPQRHFSQVETRRFVKVGVHVAGSSVLYQVYKNADYFLVGKFLGLEALGLYRVAFDVAMQPTDAIIAVVNRVGFPVYSRVAADPKALLSSFLSSTRSFLLTAAPVAAFLFIAAGGVLRVVGGESWVGAQPAVQILVWAGLLRAAAMIFPQVYLAVGRPQYASIDSVLTLVLLTSSFWFGLAYFPGLGVLSVCLAWLLAYPIILSWHLVLIRRFMALGLFEYVQALAPGFGAALCMIVGLEAFVRLLHGGAGWQFSRQGIGLVELVAALVLGLGIFAGYLRWVLKTPLSYRTVLLRGGRDSH
jgi:O-antigen/teichoic acid export membrane protein